MRTPTKSIFDERYKMLIKELVSVRNAKNISQRELAKLANVSHCYVGRIETRERRLDLIEFIDLCKVLGLSKKDTLDLIQKII